MGKRKRRTDRNRTPPSPAFTSHASQMESSLKEVFVFSNTRGGKMGGLASGFDWGQIETSHLYFFYHGLKRRDQKSFHSFGSTGAKPTSSSLTNIMERSPSANHRSSTHHRCHNVNRSLLSRVPHHYYSIKNFQRNTNNHAATSTSHGKTTLRDEKHFWKFVHRPESGFRNYAGRRDKASRRLDRIRSNPLVINSISAEVNNMVCGLCQQRTCENAVVAVLVCGHVYHADCLEVRTTNEDRRDPPCPLCMH